MRQVDGAGVPAIVERGPHEGSLGAILRFLREFSVRLLDRVNATLPKDGTEAMTGPLELSSYLTAARPTAADYEGAIIYVSDGAAGSKFQGSDGTSWVSLG